MKRGDYMLQYKLIEVLDKNTLLKLNNIFGKKNIIKLTDRIVGIYYDFSENSQEIKDYIKGLTLKGNQDKGYGLICVDGYPLSFYKESNHQIKNLYPKGLRR